MKSGASDPFGDEAGDEASNEVNDEAEGEGTPLDDEEVEVDEEGEIAARSGEDSAAQSGSGGGSGASRGSAFPETGEASHGTGEGRRGRDERVDDDTSRGGGDSGGGNDSGLDRSQIPYTLRRNNVKDERPNVHQLFVTDDTDDAAREAERDLEDILDTDVYRLDAREAIYRIGMRHPEEVAELLEEWGYNF